VSDLTIYIAPELVSPRDAVRMRSRAASAALQLRTLGVDVEIREIARPNCASTTLAPDVAAAIAAIEQWRTA